MSDPGDLQGRGRLGRISPRLERKARSVVERMAVSGKVTIGPDTRIGLGTNIWSAHGLVIDGWSAIGRRCTINCDGHIAPFAMLGTEVAIVGRADHGLDEIGVPSLHSTWVGQRDEVAADRVDVAEDVWIGARAVVLGGVSIGAGAVIAAGAVVVKDVDPFCIVGGNPGRVISQRFPDPAERAEHLAILQDKIERLRNARH